MNRILQYILRLKDEATGTLHGFNKAARSSASETGAGAAQVGGSFDRIGRSVHAARFAMMGFVSSISSMIAVFKAGWAAGAWLEDKLAKMFSPAERALAEYDKQIESSQKRISGYLNQNKALAASSAALFQKENKADADAGAANEYGKAMRAALKSNADPEDAAADAAQASRVAETKKRQLDRLNRDLADYQKQHDDLNAKITKNERDQEDARKNSLVGPAFLGGVNADGMETERQGLLDRRVGVDNRIKDLKAAIAAAKDEQLKADRDRDIKGRSAAMASVHAVLAEQEKADEKRFSEQEKLLNKQLKHEEDARSKVQDRLTKATAAADAAWEEFKDPSKFTDRKAAEEKEQTFRDDYKEKLSALNRGYSFGEDYDQILRNVERTQAEKTGAEAELKQIEANTKDLAKKLEDLLTLKDEGGK